MEKQRSCIALIPARIGSKRVKNKNILPLGGHPLIAYTIKAAVDSGIFSGIIVSTNSRLVANIAKHYGADVPFLRPQPYATDTSPDIDWLRWTLSKLRTQGVWYDCFALLRPTSPFRTGKTIQRAWEAFQTGEKTDSLRAVELCKQHPAKQWILAGDVMTPVLKTSKGIKTPWHSTPYQALPKVYAQNASLEIAYTDVILEKGSISGTRIRPFLTEKFEGYDINDEKDWIYAQYLVKAGKVKLPQVKEERYEAI